MSLPGWGTVAGTISAITYRFLDPRSKKERLLDEKQKIFAQKLTPRLAERLAGIDKRILQLEREIERRAD